MKGKVILTGAGPEAGMMTLKGFEAIRHADAILYDDLIDKDLLCFAPSGCEIIPVGKRHGIAHKSQKEIEDLLIEKALEGKTVVRLKGGDGFVFGRGGEEMIALSGAGVPCEIIPGVTSAIAVPERFGIPVTHRGASESFTVITGHGKEGRAIDFAPLAKVKGTLIFLMGIHMLGHITEELLRHGKDPETPAAVLSKGYMPGEKRIDGRLCDIAELAKDAETPGIIVIGDVAAMRLSKTAAGPLENTRVLIAGSEGFCTKLNEKLRPLGADTAQIKVLETVPQYENIPDDLAPYAWIVFTSAAGIENFFAGLIRRGKDVRGVYGARFACVGKGTASKLSEYGINADLVPAKASGKNLGAELVKALSQNEKNSVERLLIAQAEKASPALTCELSKANAVFDVCKVYRTEACSPGIDISTLDPFDFVVFSSAAAVRSFFDTYRTIPHTASFVCMGSAAKEALTTALSADDNTNILIPPVMNAEGVCEMIINQVNAKTSL